MISDREIEQKAELFQIRALDVQKDYVYGWLLAGISQSPKLSSQLILKGGNALRKGYLPDTRFSKDLDFSCQSEITDSLLQTELREVCTYVTENAGVQFVDKLTTRDKRLDAIGVKALEARLYFKSFFGEECVNLRTQLDITQFDRIYLPVQNRAIIHPYSDANKLQTQFRFQKIEEILASKLTSILHRRNPADLFDLIYSTVVRNIYGVNRLELISTFLRKSVFNNEPQNAREQLLAVPIEGMRSLWQSITVPVTSALNFDLALNNFRGFIDSLFALLPPSPTSARLDSLVRPYGSGASYGLSNRNYFPSDIRRQIIDAGRTQKMILLGYEGFERMVEPYKLEYYTRKSDGQSLEYFWGYDNTGGRSRQIGIKQFICDKILSVRPTDKNFAPRYRIEL